MKCATRVSLLLAASTQDDKVRASSQTKDDLVYHLAQPKEGPQANEQDKSQPTVNIIIKCASMCKVTSSA